MKTIRQILAEKSPELCSIHPEASVREALELMERANVGSVLVLDGGRVVGIFTERDFARKAIHQTQAPSQIRVREMMTDAVCYVTPAQSVEECMALMTEKRVRHLPVLEHDAMIGILSIGDVVKAVIDDREFLIEQLATYIQHGKRAVQSSSPAPRAEEGQREGRRKRSLSRITCGSAYELRSSEDNGTQGPPLPCHIRHGRGLG